MRLEAREFMRDLRTGKTPIMRLLDGVLEDPAAQQNHPHLEAFRVPGHVDTVCPECIEWLQLSPEETDHIDHWPAPLKERVRKAIVEAIDEGSPIKFYWGISDREDEAVGILDLRDVKEVHFGSPKRVVRVVPGGPVGAQIEVTEVARLKSG